MIAEAVRLMEQKDQELQPSSQRTLTEEEIDQHLVEVGLMSTCRRTQPGTTTIRLPACDHRGGALSETIIRERR